MILWRRARTEVAGAWRSVRYDLGRPAPDAGGPATGRGAPGPAVSRDAGYPDVTSSGCHTFGDAGRDDRLRAPSGEEPIPRPRRLAAVSAFGFLAVAGAAGSYLAMAHGIGALAGETPAGAEPYPLATAVPRGTEGDRSHSGLGGGTADATGRTPGAAAVAATSAGPTPGTIRVLPATTAPVTSEVVVPRPRPATASSDPETPPTDCCPNPPVPTPTAPDPAPDTPSAAPSPTASSPDGSESPEPGESPSSAAPSASDDAVEPAEDAAEDPAEDEDENHNHHFHRR